MYFDGLGSTDIAVQFAPRRLSLTEQHGGSRSDLAVTFATADREVAHEHLTRTFAEHDLRVRGDDALDFRIDVVPSQQFLMSRVRFGAAVGFDAPPMKSAYQIDIPIAGTSTLAQRNTRRTAVGGAAGLVMHPGAALSLQWDAHTTQYAMKFPREPLEAHAAKLVGLPSPEVIEFDLSFDLTTDAGRALVSTANFAYTEFARPGGIATMPWARSEFESVFMTQLLYVAPSQLSPLLHRGERRTRRGRIREVVDYIDRHPDLRLETADLTEYAGLGPRALQAGFREVVGMSPSAYVRGVRLDRVHQDLLNGHGTVSEIAARWGFYHPGHFARHYRARFGATPSDTVRNGR